jgi:hypothetical protein
MKAEDFSLISKSENAQHLVVAWPQVKRQEKEPIEHCLDEWARKAQVPVAEAYRWHRTLLDHEMIYLDGKADETCLQFIRFTDTRRLTGGRQPRPPQTPPQKS